MVVTPDFSFDLVPNLVVVEVDDPVVDVSVASTETAEVDTRNFTSVSVSVPDPQLNFKYVNQLNVDLAVTSGPPGPQGEKGERGDTGATGPAGERGLDGATGATGPSNTLYVGTVTTGAAGSSALVNITGTSPVQTLNFTIPRGDTGLKGDTGNTGATGPANSLTIGTVVSGTAAATIVGTPPNQTLNLTLPTGPAGANGSNGPPGADGPPNTLNVGTVTTGDAGTDVVVEITGDSPVQTLNFTIPRGDKGTDGVIGADGRTILYGTAAPTTEGNDGDFYIRTSTNYLYGPKAGGSWPSGTSLIGPTGAAGSTGATGPAGLTTATYQATAPSSPNIGEIWIDSDSTPAVTRKTYTAVTSTYAVLLTDWLIEATSGTFTVTLPTASGYAGWDYVIKNSGTGTITLATTSSQTIDQVLNQTITSGSSITVVSNGTNWVIV